MDTAEGLPRDASLPPTEDAVQVVEGGSSPSGHRRCSSGHQSRRRSSLGGHCHGFRRNSIRRLSRQFLTACLADGDSDNDFWSVCSDSDESFASLPSSPRKAAFFFCMTGDSDSECGDADSAQGLNLEDMFRFSAQDFQDDDDVGQDLEDIFSFDLDKVADALRRGASLEELQDVIEEAMAANIEAIIVEPSQLHSITEPIDDLSPMMAGDMTPQMSDDLAGRMTHPLAAATLAGYSSSPAAFAGRLADKLAASPACRRRSSVGQCRRLSVAMKEACMMHSQSLAKAAAQELNALGEDENKVEVAAEIRQCVLSSHRQRRQSIMKAAEVLELAGVAGDSDEDSAGKERLTSSEVTAQLQLVQQAYEGARSRHRQSIAQAVKQVAEPKNILADAQHEQSVRDSARDRVAQAIAAQYAARQKSESPRKNRDRSDMTQSVLALLKTRASVAGRAVHCGPRKPLQSASRRQRKNGTPGGA